MENMSTSTKGFILVRKVAISLFKDFLKRMRAITSALCPIWLEAGNLQWLNFLSDVSVTAKPFSILMSYRAGPKALGFLTKPVQIAI